jgi:hypothetical protein
MMRRLVLAALMTLASSTFADAEGIWTVKCPYSHTNNDDPIRFPGQVGASHTHDFLGNETANALSTRKSMLNGSTTCGTEEDKAGYWVPALYKDGVKINPDGQWGSRSTREKFYYSDSQYTSSVLVEPFPPNFRMIQGYALATSIADANAHGAYWGLHTWWGCSDNSVRGKPTAPPDCKTGILTLHIKFPSCWDGVEVNGDAVAAGHVTFPNFTSKVCPATHPRALPVLIMRLEYPVGTSSSGITLASGPVWTAHAVRGSKPSCQNW